MAAEELRNELVRLSRSLFDRGFSVGSAGNISVAVPGGILITPTNSCLGSLDPSRLSLLDSSGRHVAGDPPSKEAPLHRAFYQTRKEVGAVVHLHSTYATALSCLTDLDPEDCIEPLTPYLLIRVGKVRLLPYFRPGDPLGGKLVAALDGRYAAVLLANHGPVVAGLDLRSAVYAAEELEETAKLNIILRGLNPRRLSESQIAELGPMNLAGNAEAGSKVTASAKGRAANERPE